MVTDESVRMACAVVINKESFKEKSKSFSPQIIGISRMKSKSKSKEQERFVIERREFSRILERRAFCQQI
ncbi:MAG: hypothetical protein PF439_05895 [Helicobacteraceae bacterium]|jgi:hypothetical protein|nr:hypothetical protein [Helicobacteraceae bacterium]